jgi:hypothetical protein
LKLSEKQAEIKGCASYLEITNVCFPSKEMEYFLQNMDFNLSPRIQILKLEILVNEKEICVK